MKKHNGNLVNCVALSAKYGGYYAWLSIVCRLFTALLPLLEVKVVAVFVDSTLDLFEKSGEMKKVYLAAVCLGGVIGLQWLAGKMRTFTDAKMVMEIREQFCPRLLEKCARLKYDYIENDDAQDKIMRVTREPEKELFEGFSELFALFSMVVRVVGIVIIIAAKVWWCGILVLLLHLPIVYFAKKNGENAYQADKDFAQHMRRYEYLDGVLVGRESAMERNLFRYSQHIHKMWAKEYEVACAKYIRSFFKYFFSTKLYSIFSVLASLAMILFLLGPVTAGKMSVGLFIAVVSNLLAVVAVIVQQLSQNIRELSRKKAYMDDLQDFWEMEEETPEILECPSQAFENFQTLEFKKVSFRYPGTDTYVLKEISFILERGKHYAFVGENAAGKTTITKLILGLYDSYEGEILLNGKELRQYAMTEIKGLCAVAYQDFARYAISVRDNVAIGALNQPQEQCDAKVQVMLKELGLWDEVEHMPQKEATVLGKFSSDDRELSLGQWQRIAIARAMLKEAPLRILDEPSASLDPISESHMYAEYDRLNRGMTTIFITHRLGSIKLADVIFVFEDGRLLAQGSYEKLISSCDQFKIMYETQRSWYE